jgi:hypothetical protein
VHTNHVPVNQRQRLNRLAIDVLKLRDQLTRAQIRMVYDEIEKARDALSAILDRADGKNA